MPIPGSPPMSMSDPGTIPPPSTRFSSVSWQSMRMSAVVFTLESRTGAGRPCAGLAAREAMPRAVGAVSGAIFTSLNVFQAPHEGQRPNHFTLSCPQFSQTYAVFVFAIIERFFVLAAGLQACRMFTKLLNSRLKSFTFDKNSYFCRLLCHILRTFPELRSTRRAFALRLRWSVRTRLPQRGCRL